MDDWIILWFRIWIMSTDAWTYRLAANNSMAVRAITKTEIAVVEGSVASFTGTSRHNLQRTMNGTSRSCHVDLWVENIETSAKQCLIDCYPSSQLTSSFTSLFPHTAEEPRTEKQSKAWMAEDRIFMLEMVATMFYFWKLWEEIMISSSS
jgi:UDP-3-O-acyl-N-acetylglucosamine deacetylase